MATALEINSLVKVEKGSGTFSLYTNAGKMFFLGSDLKASVDPGYDGVNPITFVFPTETTQIGIVVVSILLRDKRHSFFIKVGQKDGKPYVFAQEKDTPWIPPADKLAQVDDHGKALSVEIDGSRYTTSPKVDGKRLPVSAGNLLCRYLASVGEESKKLAKEIRELVIDQELEVLAHEKLKEVEKKLSDMENSFEGVKSQARKAIKTFEIATEETERYKEAIVDSLFILKDTPFWIIIGAIKKVRKILNDVLEEKK